MRKAPPLPAADNTLAHGTEYVRAIGDRDTQGRLVALALPEEGR